MHNGAVDRVRRHMIRHYGLIGVCGKHDHYWKVFFVADSEQDDQYLTVMNATSRLIGDCDGISTCLAVIIATQRISD
jgi:hypothetical protein